VKKNVKATISFFRLLIEHSQKEYEPSPEHILKRMLLPLCRNFSEIAKEGTRTMPGMLFKVSLKSAESCWDELDKST